MCGVRYSDLVMRLQKVRMGGGGLRGEAAGDGGGFEMGEEGRGEGVVSQMKLKPRSSCSTSVLY